MNLRPPALSAANWALNNALESRVVLAAGNFDATFGNDGFVRVPAPNEFQDNRASFTSVRTQDDGKIVVAGNVVRPNRGDSDIVIRRFTANGSIDTNFGSGGAVIRDILDNSDDYVSGLAIQPDGKILLAGRRSYFNEDPGAGFLIRLNANGSPDPSFGNGGEFTDEAFAVRSMTVAADGKIIAPGLLVVDGEEQFAVIRLTANGRFDPTFNGDGRFRLPRSRPGYASAAAIQPDGKIVVGGNVGQQDSDANFLIARLFPNGTLDPSFSGDGSTVVDGSNRDAGGAVLLQPNGRILVGGDFNRWDGASHQLGVLGLRPDGSLDTGFGDGGRLLFRGVVGGPTSAGSNLGGFVRLSDGSIISRGYLQSNDNDITSNSVGAFVVKFRPNGTLDTSFVNNGYRRTSSGNVGLFIESTAVQRDGRLLLVGFERTSDGRVRLFLARMLLSDTAPATVTGRVFRDVDADGRRDAGDRGLGSVVVWADLDRDGRLDGGEPSELTDQFGQYAMTVRAPGSYLIRARSPSGPSPTLPDEGTYVVAAVPGRVHGGRDFAFPAALIGRVFSDFDGDSRNDSNEPGAVNLTVYLDTNRNGRHDPGERTTRTNGSGVYAFKGIFNGTYVVRVDLPSGLVATGSVARTVTINGSDVDGQDLGVARPASVSGIFFYDRDRDGRRDSGERLLAGRIVYIDANNNGRRDGGERSATTDSAGRYAIGGLKPGRVVVRTTTAGSFSTPSNGDALVTLMSGIRVDDLNFGLRPS